MRTTIRYGYVPLFYLGLGSIVVVLASNHRPLWTFTAVVAAAVALSFAAERALPYETSWNDDQGDSVRDTVHAVLNEGLMLASVGVVPLLATLNIGLDLWPAGVPMVVQVGGAVLVADFGITVAHMASHRIEVLWRFHAVHHSVTRSYGFNGLMKHPVSQVFETSAGVLPLVLIGIPLPVASALAAFVALQLLLQHSNVDYRVGPLRGVLALNEGHRFHHLKWAGVGDVNFGLFTLVWDHAAGTFSYDPERRFSSSDLGMAAKPEYPRSWPAQMLEPFRTSGACSPGEVQQAPGEAVFEGSA
jgi:sterol desaturase/sphingolipid hydroxylase (fatty acid hydroxylase superfamily)